jgi:hypothetical protein
MIALLALVWLAPAARAGGEADIQLGQTVLGSVDSPGSDLVRVHFTAVQGTLVSIRVRTASDGFSTLTPTAVLKDDLGTELDLGGTTQATARNFWIRRFAIPASGDYVFEIGGSSGNGFFRAKTLARFPRRLSFSGDFPADATQGFDVMPGSQLRAHVAADGGSGYGPVIDSVVDAEGALVLDDSLAGGGFARFGDAVSTVGGPITLNLGGTGSGAYSGAVVVRTPRSRSVVNTATSGRLAGTVTNALTGGGIAGLSVALVPAVPGIAIVTDANGGFSSQLPTGPYSVSFAYSNFQSQTEDPVFVVAGVTSMVDVALDPDAPVVVSAGVSGGAVPGGVLAGTASFDVLDDSTLISIAWSQTAGAAAIIDDADPLNASITLPSLMGFKQELILVLSEPPISAEDLPPNVPLPPGEFPAGLQNRWQVVGASPLALEEAGHIALQVTVVTDSGTYTEDVEIHADLPWKPSAGILNVPIDTALILHGKDHVDEAPADGINDITLLPATYDWAASGPGGAVTLDDATLQNPGFTPNSSGLYTVTVTDTTQLPGTDVITLEIYAGTFRGIIVGEDANGRPVSDGLCTGCHSGFAPDKFTPWAETGHAEIFTNNLNTSSYYNPGCFSCHLVGYDPDADNGGADEASDFAAFLSSGLLGSPASDNWSNVLANYPDTAQLANIQCENCHGPQMGGGHAGDRFGDPYQPRVSLSSDVCATCHGEPLRHARFQQWQLSAHANYEVAIDEGDSGSCSRCHTANGFLTWLPILLDDDPLTDPTANITVTWTADEVHPQTCATCHDPHAAGTTTGVDTDARVRISGNTPPLIAGFQAIGVGRGAICMTCHNSRRGLRNESIYPGLSLSDRTRAPHGSAQSDVLMGQNAYFVTVGTRGKHASAVEDTCVNCHMEKTPPPALLSYNLGGTNHTFFASPEICSSCHGPEFDAVGVQTQIDWTLDFLQAQIESAMIDLINAQIAQGYEIDLDGDLMGEIVVEFGLDEDEDVEFGESRGRQALTFTLADTSVVGPVRVNSIDVIDPSGPTIVNELYGLAADELIKAGWNWALIHNDGSHGVHNPSYAFGVLDSAILELNVLAALP